MTTAANPTHIRDMFDNKHLAAEDLRGKPWTLTIADVVPGKLPKAGSGKVDKRPIVSFVELEAKATKDSPAKTLVCNATNYKTIKALYGPTREGWIGKRVTIFPSTCRFGRDTVPCIRVEDQAPPPAKKSGAGEAKDIPSKPVDPPPDPDGRPCTKTSGCGGDDGHDGDCSP